MDALAPPLCPCCHRPLEGPLIASDLAWLDAPGNSTVAVPLLSLLAHAWPRSLSLDVLVEHIYASRPNGEPEYAAKSVQTTIVHLRQRLAPYGWTISDARRESGYRLERILP